jgi:hypothetical protein
MAKAVAIAALMIAVLTNPVPFSRDAGSQRHDPRPQAGRRFQAADRAIAPALQRLPRDQYEDGVSGPRG